MTMDLGAKGGSGWLAALSVGLAIGAVGAYALLLRVAIVRNHPEGYVVAFALATALAALAVVRARARRWPVWLALGLSSLLLVAGAWFNFVVARVPEAPTALRVGERPPDFTLPDAAGRLVSLADYRGKKPVVLVFYRGYW
ncbi:MAG: redoxin domain-containing protein [Candidatus Rokubacteria bacterium]|nr:redoxin domain-containing protein [Candidatus Rokubacteria bacterium]